MLLDYGITEILATELDVEIGIADYVGQVLTIDAETGAFLF